MHYHNSTITRPTRPNHTISLHLHSIASLRRSHLLSQSKPIIGLSLSAIKIIEIAWPQPTSKITPQSIINNIPQCTQEATFTSNNRQPTDLRLPTCPHRQPQLRKIVVLQIEKHHSSNRPRRQLWQPQILKSIKCQNIEIPSRITRPRWPMLGKRIAAQWTLLSRRKIWAVVLAAMVEAKRQNLALFSSDRKVMWQMQLRQQLWGMTKQMPSRRNLAKMLNEWISWSLIWLSESHAYLSHLINLNDREQLLAALSYQT